jgi:hypothetical protein
MLLIPFWRKADASDVGSAAEREMTGTAKNNIINIGVFNLLTLF